MTEASIPLPLLVVVDDVGWWRGRDGHAHGEPYRTGIDRNHVPADYHALAQLGQALHMRVQAAMILGEWDTRRLLRQLPSANWMGSAWDNRDCPGTPELMEQAAAVLRDERDWIELTLHGLGHEYWQHDAQPAGFTRAEWSQRDGTPRPAEHLRGLVDLFGQLLDQHQLGAFPESFVPCAFCHGFDTQVAQVLHGAGIRYASTPFSKLAFRERVPHARLGVEAGILTIDRGIQSPLWNALAVEPATLPGYAVDGPVCGLHWPNLLHADPTRNGEVVAQWVAFLHRIGTRFDRLLARDTRTGWTQLAYCELTRCVQQPGTLEMDFTAVDALGRAALAKQFTIKVRAAPTARFTAQGVALAGANWQVDQRCHVLRVQRQPGSARGRLTWNP